MASLGDLIVKIGGDTSDFDKSINRMQGSLGGFGESLKSGLFVGAGIAGFEMLRSGMQNVVTSFQEGIKYASDLAEVQNVVDTAFGTSSAQINTWAQSTLANFGLTELQAKQMSGSMRAMLGSMGMLPAEADKMAMSLTELAGDFSSFYNLSHDEAWGKIRAGIAGETEPLKSLGINMSVANMEAYALTKGINSTWNAMSVATQTQLRYNYLLESGKLAIGDFAKTSQSYANQLRVFNGQLLDFKGKMAQAFMPMASELLKITNDILPKLQKALTPILNYMQKEFTPIMQKVIEGAKAVFNDLFKSIEEFSTVLQKQGIKEALKVLIPDIFVEMGHMAIKIFQWFIDHGTIVKGVILGIGTAFAVFYTITTAVNLARMAVTAFSAVVAFLSTPVGLTVAIIGVLAGLAYIIYQNWSPISEFFKSLWGTVVAEFEVAKARMNMVLTTLGSAMASHFDFMLSGVLNFVNGVINLFSKIPGLEDKFTGVQTIISNLQTAVQSASYSAHKSYQDSKDAVLKAERAMEESWGRVTSSSKKVYESLKNDVTGAYTIAKEQVTSVLKSNETMNKTTTDNSIQNWKDVSKNIEGSTKKVSEKIKTTEKDFENMTKKAVTDTDKMGQAIIKALKIQYTQEQKLLVDKLDEEYGMIAINTRKRIKAEKEIFDAKMKNIISTKDPEIKAYQDKIDALNKVTENEEKALKEREFQQRISNLKKEIETNKSNLAEELRAREIEHYKNIQQEKGTDKHLDIVQDYIRDRKQITDRANAEQLRIQTELNDMYAENEREKLLELRAIEIKKFEDKIKSLDAEKQAEIDKATASFNNEKNHLENMQKVQEANKKDEIEAVKEHFATLMTEEKLNADARRILIDNDQKSLIVLLKGYLPDWKTAGQSFGEQLLEGLNSKKQSIQSAVADLMRIVNNANYTLQTAIPIGPKFFDPVTGIESFTKPAQTLTAPKSITSSNNSINVNVQLDGRTIAKASAPAMVRELKLQGVT